MNLFETRNCIHCRRPVTLIPLIGWQHVNMIDNLDCDAEA